MCTCIETLSITYPVAKKAHRDSSAEWIQETISYRNIYGMSFSELREIVKLRQNHWNIMPGQRYERQRNKYEGDIYTFKSLPEIIKICNRHKIYPDFC